MTTDVSVVVEILTFVFGCTGIAISNWRGHLRTSNKLEILAQKVEEQNGTLKKTVNDVHTLELTCAATHGVRRVRLVPDTEDGD